MEKLSFPLEYDDFTKWGASHFPTRRMPCEGGEEAAFPHDSVSFRRFLTSVHFEFCEFHRKISQPLEDGSDKSLTALTEYATGLVRMCGVSRDRLAAEEGGMVHSAVSRAGQLLDLTSICLVDSDKWTAGRIPRWLIDHSGIPLESLIEEATDMLATQNIIPFRFWEIVKIFAILDLSPVIAKLLHQLLDTVPKIVSSAMSLGGTTVFGIQLLLSFFEEAPSLFDIAMTCKSKDQATQFLEKRRAFASASHQTWDAKRKDDDISDLIDCIWKLEICEEHDYDDMLSKLMEVELGCDLTTPERLGLAWTWLHPLDEPGDALLELSKLVPAAEEMTIVDSCVYYVFSSDMLSLLTTVASEPSETFGGKWMLASLVDLVYYTGGCGAPFDMIAKLRDKVFMEYSHWLTTELGLVRFGADIVQTLSPEASQRGVEEILPRLCKESAKIGRTKQWLLTVKRAYDLGIDGESGHTLAESMSLEKYQDDVANGRWVDAIHDLGLSAEVSRNINVGTCRISDVVDGYGDELLSAMILANKASLEKISFLPNYIESGRLEFLAKWAKIKSNEQSLPSASDLVTLVTSPDCPSESVVPLVTEIRHAIESKRDGKQITSSKDGLLLSDGIAIAKRLIDVEDDVAGETLLQWVSSELVNASLVQ